VKLWTLRHPKASFSPDRFSSVQVVRHRNPSSACGKQSSAGSHDNRSQNRKAASDERIGSRFWEDQSRKTRAGSVRVARHPGKRQAATVVRIITANAAPNARGSRGLTL
jgi:hypothetical protein